MTDTIPDRLDVLLVEDNPNDVTLIERHLRETDSSLLPTVDVAHCDTIDAAIERLQTADVDVLLLDLGLGATKGMDTYDRIEAHVEETPVVVLTNLDDEQVAVNALKRGAQDYINKGNLDRQRLVNALRYALERQRRERELEAKTEQLEVLNRIIRHDIGNDLLVLRAWTEEVQSRLDGQDRADLQRVLDAAAHIRELTETSREYMELITGDSDVETKAVELRPLLRDELERRKSLYEQATFVVDGEIPAVEVLANEMLSTVFRNLLNNAVQHNDADEPRVEVRVTTDADTVSVAVADNGPGVDDARKGEIFGKGQQGLDSAGTGIGLYLVNRLVESYGGDVTVSDDDPRGAVFTVTLPRGS